MSRFRALGRRGPRHEPERDASAYLSRDLRRGDRERFEQHLLQCEQCWSEVRAARVGRPLAEQAREVAPSSLRESVRASVQAEEIPPQRRRKLLVPALAVMLAGVLALGAFAEVVRAHQPKPIAAALAAFRSNRVPAAAPHRPAPDLSAVGLRLLDSGSESVGGLPVDLFAYEAGATGNRVFLFMGDRPFPEARGATERAGSTHPWDALDGGVSLKCAESPVSYLLMGADPALLAGAEQALREHQAGSA